MDDMRRDLYDAAFRLWHMEPAADVAGYGPAGTLYTFDDDRGRGAYWAYFRNGLFAVNSFEMSFARTGLMRYRHREHLSIACYEEVRDVSQGTGAPLAKGRVCVYVGNEDGEYLARFGKGGRMRAVSVTVSPDYYRDYLQARFGPLGDLRAQFALVDGRRDLPELVSLFRTVGNYRGEGPAADLFYEGAVAETVSLVLGKARALGSEAPRVARDDRRTVEDLCSFIAESLDADLSCAALAGRAYLGQTKLKRLFKAVTGMAPGAYVARQRMERAAELLASTDKTVEQIAGEVGYKSPAAFSTAYRRHRGVSPADSR